ncbi:MAG: hypothetical protein ACM3U1_06595 [Chloroflexota bacterium]
MASTKRFNKSYLDLFEHNTLQILIFFALFAVGVALFFWLGLPIMEHIFIRTLSGRVYNDGSSVAYMTDMPDVMRRTSYLFSWAIDIYLKTPQEGRYWFSPAIALVVPASLFGMAFTITLSSLLPQGVGFIRQKIEREIASTIARIAMIKYGYHAEEYYTEIEDELLSADLRDLHNYVAMWNISAEDLRTLVRALKWRNGGAFYRMTHINDGIRIYMRFYFTVQYTNTVLGFVYIGAAFLIIIIGLRGLKFIPSNEPSMVFFALGLEFSMLITYAFTLMYSKQEEEPREPGGETNREIASSGDASNAKEIESLLRIFIKSKKK